MLVFFYRYTPTVLTSNLAEALNVTQDDISIFGSMYFWTYSCMQPIGGVLSDVLSPGKLIALSTILSAIGSIIMGESTNFALSCFARMLIGIGCGPIFVPATRILSNWYSHSGYPIANGILLAMGSVGGCLAQGPLASLCDIIDWRWAFRMSSITGVVVAVICFFVLKRHPADCGYIDIDNIDSTGLMTSIISTDNNGVYTDVISGEKKISVFRQLFENLKIVVTTKQFYILVLWDFFSPSCFYNITALWASRYLVDVINVDKTKADYMILVLSAAMIVGSPLWPLISNLAKSRKWVFCASTLIGLLTCVGFIFISKNIGTVLILVLLFLFAIGTNANVTILNAVVREINHDVAATMLGCCNFFPFFASGLLQLLSPVLINLADDGKGDGDSHSPQAYMYGLWLPNAICMLIAFVSTFFLKETIGKKTDNEVTVYN